MRSVAGKWFLLILVVFLFDNAGYSQLTVSAGSTAAALAAMLAGPGVTIASPVLTCNTTANGTFTVTPATPLGGGATWPINTGIMLSTGKATQAIGAESFLASTSFSGAGDPALTTLAGAATHDACILQFDIIPTGDTIRFNYVFGSEEYNHSTCGPYNDAFAFFISGPGITGTQNMALVPGTTIPVTVNTVNSGVPGAGYTLANCTSMGAGSPFTSYFNDNTGGTYFTMKGFTTRLTAAHDVTPCGTYHMYITIADAGNDIYDSEVFIEKGSITSNAIIGAGLVCAGASTTLSSPSAGGTWSSGNLAVATVAISTGIVTGISAGTAAITYTTGVGCYSTAIVTVTPGPAISGPLNVCNGGIAALTGTPAGGTWSSLGGAVVVSPAGMVTASSPGTAVISYSIGAGCSTSAMVTINPLPAITGPMSLCVGGALTLTATPAGGTWSGGGAIASITPGGIAAGLAAGSASVTYTAPSGCVTTGLLTVLPGDPISGTLSLCQGAGDTLSETATGGAWQSSNTGVVTVGPVNGILAGISSGTAVVSYTLPGGCYALATVTVNPVPAPPAVTTPVYYCLNDVATPLAASGTGLLWYTSDTTTTSISIAPTPSTSVTGTFRWWVSQTSAQGCISPRSAITVRVSFNTAPVISVTDTVFCLGTYITFQAAGQGGDSTSINWNFGDGFSIHNLSTVSHAFLQVGVFTVAATANSAVCPDATAKKVITVFPDPVVDLGPDTSICPGSNPLIIGEQQTGGFGAQKPGWRWNTGQTTQSITVTSPGLYYLTVNLNGCLATDSILVANDCYLDIPNAFTPNGDGVNDYFFPRSLLSRGLTEFSMNIYNRWGGLIFQTASLDGRGWDGRFNGMPQPEGVFIYVIDAKFKDGQHEHHQGNLTLLR